jgi:cell wall-associated NlpC family hydrolase
MYRVEDVLTRAHSACGQATVYWLGEGGLAAVSASPTSALPVGRLWPTLAPERQRALEPWALAAGLDVHDPALVVRACDCSGFVCWALGFGRKIDPAPYTDAAGWIYTDSIWADAMGAGVRFERRARATPGALVVYPKAGSGENYGHVGIVMEADSDGHAHLVAHCAAQNFKVAPFDAIKITSAEVFERQPRCIYAWCRTLEMKF